MRNTCVCLSVRKTVACGKISFTFALMQELAQGENYETSNKREKNDKKHT